MILYDRIKGLSQGGTTDSGLFTYITFSRTTTNPSDAKNNSKADFLPDVSYSVGLKNSETLIPLGRMITSAAVDQSIDEDFVFKKRVDVRGKLWVGDKGPYPTYEPSDKYNFIGLLSSANDWGGLATPKEGNDNGCVYLVSGDNGNEPIYVAQFDGSKQTFYNKITLLDSGGASLFNRVNIKEDLFAQGPIFSGTKVEAPYFNATSDERAKYDIEPANFDATSIVNDLPVYTFHYRNSDAPSVGVIAQEAKKLDGRIKDFSLVDNPNASGENGDYMTIKESKLVYILWKANQELSARVTELEKQLDQIKKTSR